VVSASLSTVAFTPDIVEADGVTQATITVTVRDGQGQPMAAQGVNLYLPGTGNTLLPASGPTDVNGVFQATLSSTVAETKLLTVEVNPFPHNVRLASDLPIPFLHGQADGAHSSLTASPSQGWANGNPSVRLTARIADSQDRALPSVNVVFHVTGTTTTLVPPQGVTAANGTVSALLGSTTVGLETVTLEANGVLLSTSVQVEFVATPPCTPLDPLTIPVPDLQPAGAGYTLELGSTTAVHYQGTIRASATYTDWSPMIADILVCSGGYLDPQIMVTLGNHTFGWTGPGTPTTGEFAGIYVIPGAPYVAETVNLNLAQGPVSMWGFPVNRVLFDNGTWINAGGAAHLLLVTHICF
jgi:hypothetical protein